MHTKANRNIHRHKHRHTHANIIIESLLMKSKTFHLLHLLVSSLFCCGAFIVCGDAFIDIACDGVLIIFG